MRHIDLDLNDIPEGRPIRVEEDRLGIVVVREGDRIVAFEDVCPHAHWRLSDGEIDRRTSRVSRPWLGVQPAVGAVHHCARLLSEIRADRAAWELDPASD